MSGGPSFGGLGQALGGIGNAMDGVFDQQRAQRDQFQWALSAQEAALARCEVQEAYREALTPKPPARKETTFREQLQHETDEWLKGIEL